jgi:hypothetical protein
MEFVRTGETATDSIDPSGLFLHVQDDTRRCFGYRVAVDPDTPGPLWPVSADAVQMERSIRTIVSYAVDAMPYGGSIAFRATNIEASPNERRVHPFVRAGRYVRFDFVCSRTLGVQEHLEDFAPLRQQAGRDGSELAHIFGLVKRSGGYLWIGTDQRSSETALTMLWPAARPS